MRGLEEIFDVQFIARNPLNRLNDQISQSQFASMVSRLLFEKLVEGRRVPAESNGDLSCFVIIDKARVGLN